MMLAFLGLKKALQRGGHHNEEATPLDLGSLSNFDPHLLINQGSNAGTGQCIEQDQSQKESQK